MIRISRGEVQTEARLLAVGATMAACLTSNEHLGRGRRVNVEFEKAIQRLKKCGDWSRGITCGKKPHCPGKKDASKSRLEK